MQIANIDSVGIVFGIFFPPIGTLVVYGCAYAVARSVTGGQPLSQPTKTFLRYGSLFILGMGYLISIFGILKLPEPGLWASVIAWAALVVWFARWRHQKEKQSEDKSTSTPTG